jgi:hypothetical protein
MEPTTDRTDRLSDKQKERTTREKGEEASRKQDKEE